MQRKERTGRSAYTAVVDCYYSAVSRRGVERFSFEPLVTLYPGVSMGTRADWCPELETLAVNLLLHANPAWRGIRSARRARQVTRRYARALALQCLANFAGRSWALAAETIIDSVDDLDSEPAPRSAGVRRRVKDTERAIYR
jgi:hypothetical protein